MFGTGATPNSEYFSCILGYICGGRTCSGLTVPCKVALCFSSFSSPFSSFILLVSEFTQNFISQILQYNSFCPVCPLACTALCFCIFTVTQYSILTSVGHFHFVSPQETPLSTCPLAVVTSRFLRRWQPSVHSVSYA